MVILGRGCERGWDGDGVAGLVLVLTLVVLLILLDYCIRSMYDLSISDVFPPKCLRAILCVT